MGRDHPASKSRYRPFYEKYSLVLDDVRPAESRRNIRGHTFLYYYDNSAPIFTSRLGDFGDNKCNRRVFNLDKEVRQERKKRTFRKKARTQEDDLPEIPRKVY